MSGYKGRTGVHELMTVDDEGAGLIHSRPPRAQLFVAAAAPACDSMREDGERLSREGITSLEEVLAGHPRIPGGFH